MKSCKITYTILFFDFQDEQKHGAQRTQVRQKLESDHPGLQKHPKQQSWAVAWRVTETVVELTLNSDFPVLFYFLLGWVSSGWSGRAAGRDGGDARQLPGGGGVPAAGAAQGTGPLQQELPHPAVPPAEGRAEKPASGPDWPGGRRAAEESGAGPEGLGKAESLSLWLCKFVKLPLRVCCNNFHSKISVSEVSSTPSAEKCFVWKMHRPLK